jgi:hypothetical protein
MSGDWCASQIFAPANFTGGGGLLNAEKREFLNMNTNNLKYYEDSLLQFLL